MFAELKRLQVQKQYHREKKQQHLISSWFKKSGRDAVNTFITFNAKGQRRTKTITLTIDPNQKVMW